MEGEERKLVEEKLARIYLKKLIYFRHFSFSFHLLFSHLYPNIGLNFKFYFMFEIYSFLLIYINKEFNNLILNLKWNCNSFFLLFNFFFTFWLINHIQHFKLQLILLMKKTRLRLFFNQCFNLTL